MIQEKTGLERVDILSISGGLLLTLAGKGSLIEFEDEVIPIPAIKPRSIVEPTGAGDAFRGGLLRGMQLELPWEICGRMGSLAATYVLENLGTQGHYFRIQEFVDRYREAFDDQGALDILLD
jgi:adenosine kinase